MTTYWGTNLKAVASPTGPQDLWNLPLDSELVLR